MPLEQLCNFPSGKSTLLSGRGDSGIREQINRGWPALPSLSLPAHTYSLALVHIKGPKQSNITVAVSTSDAIVSGAPACEPVIRISHLLWREWERRRLSFEGPPVVP